jgi:hypothetical protein
LWPRPQFHRRPASASPSRTRVRRPRRAGRPAARGARRRAAPAPTTSGCATARIRRVDRVARIEPLQRGLDVVERR